MKIAPVFHELKFENWCNVKIIDTGQHYKDIMSKVFLNELKIKKPDFSLGRNDGTHSQQTSKIMVKYEKLCLSDTPSLCMVVGDVNSTLACALVAAKLKILLLILNQDLDLLIIVCQKKLIEKL